jgi:hypothetical protein
MPGVYVPVGWYFFGGPAAVVSQGADLIEAIVRFGRTDGDLRLAFPTNAQFEAAQSNPNTPLPRVVVDDISDQPPMLTTGPSRVTGKLVQFSVFAGTFPQSRALARLIRNKYHRRFLYFQDGYLMNASARDPLFSPPEPGTGSTTSFQNIVEVFYTIGNEINP